MTAFAAPQCLPNLLPLLLRSGQSVVPAEAVHTIGGSGDPRLLWYLHDLLRFVTSASRPIVVDAFKELSSAELPDEPFAAMGDRVLAWNLPAPPDYRLLKRDLFLLIEPRWAPFFDDEDSAIDWRLVGWGGVFIDDRPDATAGQICPRGCIPALDQPAVTDAEDGSWYPDDDLVFGIVIGRQARAYPKNVMEVASMPALKLAVAARPATFDRTQQHRRSMLGKIHIAKKQLAMDDDDYRQLLFEETGLASASKCSEAQLTRVIDRLKGLGFKPLPKAGAKAAQHPMARKARALWIIWFRPCSLATGS